MRNEFRVEEMGGVPTVRVARQRGWELMEFLSYQRINVSYRFEADDIVVCFHHCDARIAGQLVEDWQHSMSKDAACTCQPVHHHPDQWLVGAGSIGR